MDGRGLAAVLALGADGVQMGTAFLTCTEAGTNAVHREAILQGTDVSTVVTKAFTGRPARGIRNQFMAEIDPHSADILPYPLQNQLTRDIRSRAAELSDASNMSLWAGQSLALARDEGAAALVQRVMEEYKTAVAKLPRDLS